MYILVATPPKSGHMIVAPAVLTLSGSVGNLGAQCKEVSSNAHSHVMPRLCEAGHFLTFFVVPLC
jgi:hypothetical protein